MTAERKKKTQKSNEHKKKATSKISEMMMLEKNNNQEYKSVFSLFLFRNNDSASHRKNKKHNPYENQ